jgi:hypothetical protein
MANTAQSRIDEVINQFSVQRTARNIYGFIGPTLRGPINDPGGDVIRSWPQFVKKFGGLVSGNDFPLLCKRALDRGAALRVCNIKHYASITNPASLDAVLATVATTDEIELDADLTADHTMQVTVNGNSRTQAFVSSSKRTLELMAQKLMTDLPGIIQTAKALDARTLILVPKTTVTLVSSSVPTGLDAPTAAVNSVSTITDGTDELFRLKPKHRGADYNNLGIFITPALSGQAGAFDIQVVHFVDGTTETFRNLRIPGKPTVNESTYLDTIKKNSYLLDVEYLDLSAATNNTLIPLETILRFKSGTNGSALVANDYIGSSTSKLGAYAFDAFDDIRYLSAPNVSDPVIALGLDTYAQSRKDLENHVHLSNNSTTEDALITERDNTAINSSYTRFFAGGIQIVDEITGETRVISEMGDVAGVIADSAEKFGSWYSAAGKRRGIITNALGVGTNFGAKNNIANLNRLANRQINTVIVRDNQILLWGNFTAFQDNNALQYANVRSLLIEMRKSLTTLLDEYLEEPNDLPTWLALYRDVKPYLDNLVSQRAIHSYAWNGDQFAASMNDLKVNDFQDVQAGKYRVQCFIKEINSLQDLLVEITLDNSNVSFEDSLTAA